MGFPRKKATSRAYPLATTIATAADSIPSSGRVSDQGCAVAQASQISGRSRPRSAAAMPWRRRCPGGGDRPAHCGAGRQGVGWFAVVACGGAGARAGSESVGDRGQARPDAAWGAQDAHPCGGDAGGGGADAVGVNAGPTLTPYCRSKIDPLRVLVDVSTWFLRSLLVVVRVGGRGFGRSHRRAR